MSTARDDTTRYLCAAAHLDPDYADAAVREYLVEPTRSIPPSPGVNSGVVLREAVAARTRGKIRDGLLLVLTLVCVITVPLLVLTWLSLAATATYLPRLSLRKLENKLADPVERTKLLIRAAIVIWIILPFALFIPVLILQSYLFDTGGKTSDQLPSFASSDAEVTVGTITAFLIFAVLCWDRWIVWSLVTRSFRRNRFHEQPAHDNWAGEWFYRRLGYGLYGKALDLHATKPQVPHGSAETIVYRG